MPKVFLSHRSIDKTLVLEVDRYLKKSLVNTWIDRESMIGGDSLSQKILSGIQGSPLFVAFISESYFDSDWCPEEFDVAYQLSLRKQVRIIPVLLDEFEVLKAKENKIINSLLDRIKCIHADQYNIEKTAKEVVKAVWKEEPVRFKPIQDFDPEGINMQIISFETDRELPSSLLQGWDFRLDDFMAESPDDKDKPITYGSAIGFYGRAPNWIYTYLSIPLANKRDIFIYNTFTDDFICVYARPASKSILGKTIRYKIEQ